jgi:Methyltransferase domain
VADTADRSLAHWSEEGREEMDAFYRVARQDYRLLAQALDWHERLAGRATLLDVACGSGKFPEALDLYADLAPEPSIAYSLLDPSAFSLAEARRELRPPLAAAAEYECLLQDLPASAGPFDVVWAIHGLYALPEARLGDGVSAFLRALAPGGLGVIAQAAHESHYLRFYRDFLADFRDGQGSPYISAEQIRSALDEAGAHCQVRRLGYDAELKIDDRSTAEGYLQRCAFDETVMLKEMERGERLGPYLASSRDDAAGRYRFAQQVDLILISCA